VTSAYCDVTRHLTRDWHYNMTSRIPQPKPNTPLFSNPKSTRLLPLETLHASLNYLGAPPLTQEDLSRLYKGPFADALSFLVEHVRGRQACAFARQEISRYFFLLKGSQGDKLEC
jgi:hypothetical protein